MTYGNPNLAQVQRASGLNAMAALWLFVSAFVFQAEGPARGAIMTSNVVCGIVIAGLAGFRMIGAYEEGWISWLNVLFGAWVVISPWVLTQVVQAAVPRELIINNCIAGGAIVLFGSWSGFATGFGAGNGSARPWPASRA
jgi:SPW repeat